MADLITFHGSQGSIALEVESDGGSPSGGGSLAELMFVLQDVATAAVDQINRVAEETRPSEFEIRFGLKALPDGRAAVSLAQDHAHFQVRLKWGGGGAAVFPKL